MGTDLMEPDLRPVNPSQALDKKSPQLRAEAMEILEVTPEQVEAMPPISNILKKIGGRDKTFEYLRSSDDPDALKIMEKLKTLPKKLQNLLSIEVLCAASGVPTKRVLGIVAEQAFGQSKLEGDLIAAAAHPRVVEKTVEEALKSSGDKEKKLLLQHSQFLPLPKSSTVVFGNQNIDARQQTANVTILPSLESGARRMTDRFNSTVSEIRQLPEPRTIDTVIDVDDEEEEDQE